MLIEQLSFGERIKHAESTMVIPQSEARNNDTGCSSARDAEPNFIDFSDWATWLDDNNTHAETSLFKANYFEIDLILVLKVSRSRQDILS